jgi:prepilin-type N-terminal cleavage/methylation domain-containing protein
MFIKHNKANRGFTLIELLVVIAIIGVLSSVIFAALNSARSKARDAKRIADVKQLMTALELYYDEYGSYPISGNCGATVLHSGWCNSVQSYSNGHWVRSGSVTLSKFLSSDPKDPRQGEIANFTPVNGGAYYYFARGGGGPGKWYMIVFGLENYPHPMELQDGVTDCNGQQYHWGNDSNGVITVGKKNC